MFCSIPPDGRTTARVTKEPDAIDATNVESMATRYVRRPGSRSAPATA